MSDEADAPRPNVALRITLAVFLGLGLLACCGLVLPTFGVLSAIAIPNFVAMQLKAKRAEVPGNVDGIKMALLAYDAAYDEFLPAGREGQARAEVGKALRPWERTPEWERLGWRPDGDVRGAYWIVVVPGHDFEVHGVCDVDGDGELAEYVATKSTNATLVSGSWTY